MKLLLLLLTACLAHAADPALFAQKLSQAQALLDAGEPRQALTLATGLNRQQPDETVTYQLLAAAQMDLGHYSEAEKSIQWMLDLKIGKADTAGWLLVAQFREATGDADGAIDAVNLAYARLTPGQQAEGRKLAAYSARLHYINGKLNRAEAAAKQVPDEPLAIETLARVRIAQGRTPEAIELLRAAKLTPAALLLLADVVPGFSPPEIPATPQGVIHLATNGDPQKALQQAKALASKRGDIQTQTALAVALAANGQQTEARNVMQAVLAVGTQDPQILAQAAKLGLKPQ